MWKRTLLALGDDTLDVVGFLFVLLLLTLSCWRGLELSGNGLCVLRKREMLLSDNRTVTRTLLQLTCDSYH